MLFLSLDHVTVIKLELSSKSFQSLLPVFVFCLRPQGGACVLLNVGRGALMERSGGCADLTELCVRACARALVCAGSLSNAAFNQIPSQRDYL